MSTVLVAIASAFILAAAPPTDDRPLPTIGGMTTVSRIEPRLSSVVERLVGRPVEVRCWSVPDWQELDRQWEAWTGRGIPERGGYRRVGDPGRLHMSPYTCGDLIGFIYLKQRPKNGTEEKRALAEAIVTLAHEAQHVAGIKAESTAECRGQQLIRPVARMLGASKDYAAGLAVLSWRTNYPRLPASYKSPECRNGGALDMNPAASAWP